MFYSYSVYGYHKEYGEFTTTLGQLINGETEYELHKIGSPNDSTGSSVTFKKFFMEPRPSFYDFLHSGWEINLTVAIDFTASNGNPEYAHSLHHIDYSKPNQYQQALYNVGNILQNYDSDNKIPAFGFGAIPLGSRSKDASHCFHLNGLPNPE